MCKNRRNTSLVIKLSGSYKTFRKSVACLFHVKRFQTGHSARKVLFGRGAVACNAQTTPAFHVKRFQTTGRSGQDALFGRVAVGCGSQAPCVSRETLCRAETTRRHTEMSDVATFPLHPAPTRLLPECSRGVMFHVKRFAEPRQLADTRKCRTLPLFRRAPSFARLRPNAHATNCFT